MGRRVLPLKLPVICALAALLPACGLVARHGPDNSRSETVWHVVDEYVRLAPQDGVQGQTPAANDHPVVIPRAELRAALAQLDVRRTAAGANVASDAVFSAQELDTLSGPLAEGLARASRTQDVLFAITGMHPSTFGLARQVTTGRVFFQGGELNIIFGELHGHYDPDADRRLDPLPTGSRTAARSADIALDPGPGQTLTTVAGAMRPDWIRFPIAKATAQDAPAVAPPAAEPSPATPAAAPAAPASAPTVEQRLRELRRLRDEGLIDQRLYQEKARQILNQL